VRGDVDEHEAADADATAQITGGDTEPSAAGRRVGALLAASPVFFDVTAECRDELARASTLVILGRRTPIADGLAAGPLVIAKGTLLVVDAAGRPVDLVGAGIFRSPRAGRRLVALTDAQAIALPSSAADDVVATTRARLAAARPFGGASVDDRRPAPPDLATGVAADLVGADMDGGQPDGVGDQPHAAGGPALASTAPLLDMLHAMLENGAPLVTITDVDGATAGTIGAAALPVGEEAGLARLLDTLRAPSTIEALHGARDAARRLAAGALAAGADVVEACRLLTAVGDRTVRLLLSIAHRELGPPPSDYAWLVFGSHARAELTPSSDQDTGLVYATGLDHDGHGWYARLGEWMTDALEACGYRRCPGGVMASRPAWRHDLTSWAEMVRQ
jgi:CBS domain-containing protein